MSYNKFINFIFFFFIIFLTFFFIIALFNYCIDPYNFFNNNKNTLEKKVAQGIIAKKKVIIKKSVEENLVRFYLIKDYQISKEDIVVLGSARGYQVNSLVFDKAINFATSGIGIQDILAFYNLIKKKNPQSLIIIFDPWIFSKNFDHIEPYFYQYYLDESEELGYKVTLLEKMKYLKRKYFYLINSEILTASLRTVFGNVDNNYLYFGKDEKYSHDIYYGYREDGSIIYPNNIEKRHVEETNRIALEQSKEIKPENYLEKKFEFSNVKYQLFVKFIKKISVTSKVIILITPYHPLAYKELKKNNNFIRTEKLIKKENFSSNVKILGSYSPFDSGCENLDYYDYNHAKISCFNKMINIKKQL